MGLESIEEEQSPRFSSLKIGEAEIRRVIYIFLWKMGHLRVHICESGVRLKFHTHMRETHA